VLGIGEITFLKKGQTPMSAREGKDRRCKTGGKENGHGDQQVHGNPLGGVG
jgi:hypothetical protein